MSEKATSIGSNGDGTSHKGGGRISINYTTATIGDVNEIIHVSGGNGYHNGTNGSININ